MVSETAETEFLALVDPRLLEIDFENVSVQHRIIFGSFFFFLVIYILSMIITPLLISRYKHLISKEKVFWHLAIVRSIYGFFAGSIGFWALFTPTAMDKDVIFGRTPTSTFAIAASIGFFAFECSALLISGIYYRNYNLLLNLHHWISLAGCCITLMNGANHFFACKGMVLELSTPFSCLCWTMLKCGKENTLLWRANQFMLVHAFHCRSIVEGYFWYITYINWNYIYAKMPTSVYYVLYIELPLITFVMTPYWTYKKTVQMIQRKDWNFEDSNKDVNLNGAVKKND